MKRSLGLLFVAWSSACALQGGQIFTPTPIHVPPAPDKQLAMTVRGPDGTQPDGLTATLRIDAYAGQFAGTLSSGRVVFNLPANRPSGVQWHTHLDAPGLASLEVVGDVNDNGEACPCFVNGVADAEVHLVALLPPPPTRQQLLTMQVGMFGLRCTVPSLGGNIPWWDPGIQAVPEDQRQAVYACKRARGDTGIIIGPGLAPTILYDEPGNPYQVAIPAFDLAARVVEHARAGLLTAIYLDGDGDTWQRAFDEFPVVYQALVHGGPNGEDLTPYVSIMPGWDGVFYSCGGCWDNDKIQRWAALARGLCPSCVLVLEFNTGHIPLGEGGDDFLPGGRMKDFDGVRIEFAATPHDDNAWQILARLLGPAYHKPADDPNTSAPWYLRTPTVRGPWGVECFEADTYGWVRERVSQAQADQDRQYLAAMGCPVTD